MKIKSFFRSDGKKLSNYIRNFFMVFGMISFFFVTFSGVDVNGREDDLIKRNDSIYADFKELTVKYNHLRKMVDYLIEEDKNLYAKMMGVENDGEIESLYNNISYSQDTSVIKGVQDKYKYVSSLVSYQISSKGALNEVVEGKTEDIMATVPIIQPISTIDLICVSSTYGMRRHPVYERPIFHSGVDLSANEGSDIVSTARGVVDKVVYSKYGYGNKVVIDHGNGFKTLYAHLRYIKVRRGQSVKQGQKIGTVGNSGLSTGAHLHYEVLYKKKTQNPLAYFQTYMTPIDESGKIYAYKPY